MVHDQSASSAGGARHQPLAKRPDVEPAEFTVFEKGYEWVSWIGTVLYIEVVLCVMLFFAAGVMTSSSSLTDVLGARLFLPILFSVAGTAAIYLLTVIFALLHSPVGDKRVRMAIVVTASTALLTIVYCVWWASRALAN